ncbi:cAMP-dependent protein kinase catalytic subunit [Polyrhizophydium stewartii]|uniref:cAMP-dependent protein kinase n=1 Tax=Polyrhizophydium stewartii TaxID=2732419 RepID=A0ABR4NHA1_9FUNG
MSSTRSHGRGNSSRRSSAVGLPRNLEPEEFNPSRRMSLIGPDGAGAVQSEPQRRVERLHVLDVAMELIDGDDRRYKLADFELIRALGKGAFATVYAAKRISDKALLALKVMRKDRICKSHQVRHVRNEKEAMHLSRGCPFIVQMLSSFQDSTHVFLLQEYLPGGDLFQCIKTHGWLDEANSMFFAAQIQLGLAYLHENRIIYRDLKPENVLLDGKGFVKISDLGFAIYLDPRTFPDETTKSFCGTPSYIAPEILLNKPYSYAVDWWAFGILIFEMCSGCSPFQDFDTNRTYTRILRGQIRWPPNPDTFFSAEAQDLVCRLLEFECENRLGSLGRERDVRTHPWFHGIEWGRLELRRVRPPPPSAVHSHSRQRSKHPEVPPPPQPSRPPSLAPIIVEMSHESPELSLTEPLDPGAAREMAAAFDGF